MASSMTTTTVAVVVAVCVLFSETSASPSRSGTSYTECSSSSQCGAGRCCVLVNGRYATTACMARLRVGQSCRPASDRPISHTLQFPGGESVQVTEVYQNLCPCESGSSCSSSGQCVR